MAKTLLFTGAGVAIVTPFNADGSVNYDSLRNMLEYQVENGTDAIIICGTTGEASTLTDEEVLLSLQLMLLIREFQLLLVLVVMILLMVFSFVRNVKKLVLTVF